MNWKKKFDKIYPLQVWNKNNKEQTIYIMPVLQKKHKELLKLFIQNLLDKQKEEITEKFRKTIEYLISQAEIKPEYEKLIKDTLKELNK